MPAGNLIGVKAEEIPYLIPSEAGHSCPGVVRGFVVGSGQWSGSGAFVVEWVFGVQRGAEFGGVAF